MSQSNSEEQVKFVFGKKNYLYMIIGVVLIMLGSVLLSGGGSQDPEVFNPAIFDFQRMVLAPLVMLAGFFIEIFAIMYRPKNNA
jgi:hypothetical protein